MRKDSVKKKTYDLEISTSVDKEFDKLGKKNPQLLEKIRLLLHEIIVNPRGGRGKPERLKHYGDREVWSRRINRKDRIVYKIDDDRIVIYLLKITGHYDDK